MAELKTKATNASVDKFLAGVKDQQRRNDCLTVARMMQRATKAEPKMWGPSIVGFGAMTYRYESGRELEWFRIGFSPRKDSLTLYIMPGLERYPQHLAKLGKFTTGKSCLYVKKLADVDQGVLQSLIADALAEVKTIEKKAAAKKPTAAAKRR
jgi:hypothetical protein